MASKPKQPKIGPYPVPQETMDILAELQQAIRDANQLPPSKGLMLSALIYGAPRDGKKLAADFLAPYLRDHPGEEKPR